MASRLGRPLTQVPTRSILIRRYIPMARIPLRQRLGTLRIISGYSSPVSVSFRQPQPRKPCRVRGDVRDVSSTCVSIHEALLPGAKIFMSDGQTCGMNAYVWNSATNIVDTVTAPANIFCNGMDQMSDGRLLIAGGNLRVRHGSTDCEHL